MKPRERQWTVSALTFATFLAFTLYCVWGCAERGAANAEECIAGRWTVLIFGLPASLASAVLFRGVGPIAIFVTGLLGALQWGAIAFWAAGRFFASDERTFACG
jgi:hypothetical protein